MYYDFTKSSRMYIYLMHNISKKVKKVKSSSRSYYKGGQRRTRKNVTRSLRVKYTNKSKSHLVLVFLEILRVPEGWNWKQLG